MIEGVIAQGDGMNGVAWNVVGQTYKPKIHSESVFFWHADVPAETGVPPHIHPTQDEWIYMLEGTLEVEMEGQVMTVGAGDTIKMPMGIAHAIWNRSGANAKCVFGVAPSRKLYDLFTALDGVTDPAELVRLSALHEVNFLPPPE